MTPANLFTDVPRGLAEEQILVLLASPHVRIERIVSHGHASPPGFWYDQDRPEFVLLLQGRARVAFEEGEVELMPGSHLTIAAHRKHRVTWTDPDQPTIWLAVHYAE